MSEDNEGGLPVKSSELGNLKQVYGRMSAITILHTDGFD